MTENELFDAAKDGTLNQVPKENLTLKALIAKDRSRHGDTVIHQAARYGHLNQIPRKFLTWHTLSVSMKNRDGDTPIHIAASNGFLDQIPRKFLTRETLLDKNKDGETPICAATNNQKLNLIPPSVIRREYLTVKYRGSTPIEWAVWAGELGHIPIKYLSPNVFTRIDTKGDTVIHRAAEEGFLKDIPRKFLTRAAFSKTNETGHTPIHKAAEYGHLDQIPEEFLTWRALTKKTQWDRGDTPIHRAAKNYNLNLIPGDLILTAYATKNAAILHLNDLFRTSPGALTMVQIGELKDVPGYIKSLNEQRPPEYLVAACTGHPTRYAAVIRRLNPIAHQLGIPETRALGQFLAKICAARPPGEFKLGSLEVFCAKMNNNPKAFATAARICAPAYGVSETTKLWLLCQQADDQTKPAPEQSPTLKDVGHICDFFRTHPNYLITMNASLKTLEVEIRKWNNELAVERTNKWISENSEETMKKPFDHPNYRRLLPEFSLYEVTYKLLQCPNDLLIESRQLRHCVSSAYRQRALDGISLLYHVESEGIPGTIEIDPKGNLIQARGLQNTYLPYEHKIQQVWLDIQQGAKWGKATDRILAGGIPTELELAQATWHAERNPEAAAMLNALKALPKTLSVMPQSWDAS